MRSGTQETSDRWRSPINWQRSKPLRAVYGNIDGATLRAEFPEHLRFELEGLDVWITHIGGYPGRYDRRIREEIRDQPP
jgi:predicted phosphodiesterase